MYTNYFYIFRLFTKNHVIGTLVLPIYTRDIDIVINNCIVYT